MELIGIYRLPQLGDYKFDSSTLFAYEKFTDHVSYLG